MDEKIKAAEAAYRAANESGASDDVRKQLLKVWMDLQLEKHKQEHPDEEIPPLEQIATRLTDPVDSRLSVDPEKLDIKH